MIHNTYLLSDYNYKTNTKEDIYYIDIVNSNNCFVNINDIQNDRHITFLDFFKDKNIESIKFNDISILNTDVIDFDNINNVYFYIKEKDKHQLHLIQNMNNNMEHINIHYAIFKPIQIYNDDFIQTIYEPDFKYLKTLLYYINQSYSQLKHLTITVQTNQLSKLNNVEFNINNVLKCLSNLQLLKSVHTSLPFINSNVWSKFNNLDIIYDFKNKHIYNRPY